MSDSNCNFYAYLQDHFQQRLADTCLVAPSGETWSYRDIDQLSAQFATTLVASGVTPGDRVVAQVDKSPGAIGLYLGALRSGAVFVPLNTAYTAAEVEYFLGDSQATVLVCRPEDRRSLDSIAQAAGVKTIFELSSSAADHLWQYALEQKPVATITPRDEQDVAAIVYTSGTTGRAKGAMMSHGALASNTLALHRAWGFREGDVLLHALPTFHVHGLFIALHPALLNASKIILLPQFETSAVRQQLCQATVFMGVPTFYSRLLADTSFTRAACARMRVFISGSAPLTTQTSDEWAQRTGHRILERYGMSEAGVITSNPLQGERVAGTVGHPLPGVEVRICDADGDELYRGVVGSVEIRGPNLFKGYWGMRDKTAKDVRASGFFISGDLGVMDDEDRLSIVGRARDLIISGGYNIYPKEVESVLDGINGIDESAVIGVPHRDLGEGVVAILVGDSQRVDKNDLQTVLDQALARFKHPRRFYWLNELPRNSMGKIQKTVLGEHYAGAYDQTN